MRMHAKHPDETVTGMRILVINGPNLNFLESGKRISTV
jgi:hypothetical protein